MSLVPNRHRQVFTGEHNAKLEDYHIRASKLHYDFHSTQFRQFARANSSEYPSTWDAKQMAGDTWLDGFRARNPSLSLRAPEVTSIAGGTSFNKHNLTLFMDNLEKVIVEQRVSPSQIYNVDETRLTTVHRPLRCSPRKGKSKLASALLGSVEP